MLETLAAESQGLGLDPQGGPRHVLRHWQRPGAARFRHGRACAAGSAPSRAEGRPTWVTGCRMGSGLVQDQPGAGIVLLTDGWNNTGMTDDQVLAGPVATAVAQGIPICTIGIGESTFDVDQAFLPRWLPRPVALTTSLATGRHWRGPCWPATHHLGSEGDGIKREGDPGSVGRRCLLHDRRWQASAKSQPDLARAVTSTSRSRTPAATWSAAGGPGALSPRPGPGRGHVPNPPAGAYSAVRRERGLVGKRGLLYQRLHRRARPLIAISLRPGRPAATIRGPCRLSQHDPAWVMISGPRRRGWR